MTRDPHKTAARLGWNYTGDCNLECGGVFFAFDGPAWPESDYARAVDVIDLASAIDAPDGAFWIDSGSVYMPRP